MEGHNVPAVSPSFASLSRPSKALYAHRVAPSCYDRD